MSSLDFSSSVIEDQQSADVFEHAEWLRRMNEEDLKVKMDKAIGDYIDGEREMTDEEFEQYRAAVDASDGFDVPLFPDDVCELCLITPIPMTDYFREDLKPFCVAALKHYNEQKNTDYEFLRLEKANHQAVRGLLYYLTFVGRIPKDNTTQTFEARVLSGIPKNIGDDATEVEFCREKTSPSTSVEVFDLWPEAMFP